jgi:neurocan core protein
MARVVRLTLLVLLAVAMTTVAAVAGGAGVELAIKPIGELFYKPLDGAIVFTCEVKPTTSTVDSDADYINDGQRPLQQQSDTAEAAVVAGTTSQSKYKLRWFDNNEQEIVDRTGSRRYVEEEDYTKKLYITDIEQKDEGTYRCSVTVDDVPTEKLVTLRLFKEISFKSAVSPQHPSIYSNAVISCIVVGQPVPEISWRYKGRRLSLGGDRYSKVEDGLLIRNVTLADDGEYTCRAEVESDGRYDERKILVAVHIPPVITDAPGVVEGVEGEEVMISCKASGMPSATYEFFKGGVPLTSTSRLVVDSVAGTVHFKPLTKADEDVRYNCTATNDVGSDSAVGQLHVLVKPHIYELKDLRESEYQMATLVCLSTGDPAPNMTFQRVGKSEPYHLGMNDHDRVRMRMAGPGHLELTIDMLEPSDAGEYTCTAISKIGRHDDTATLTVLYKPRFASDHVVAEYVWAGKTRNVTCQVDSVPEAVIEWRRDEQKLSNNATYQIYSSGNTSTLQVTVREMDQTWIYGVYTCLAKNVHGDGQIDIEVKRASVPDEPRSVNATSRTPTAIVLLIEPPDEDGGMPVLGYRVEYSDIPDDNSAVTVDGTGPPYETLSATESEGTIVKLENLKPSTTYELRVRAKNEVGVGSPLRYVVTTEAIRPPYPVEITSSRNGEHTSQYRIVWSKPNTGGRPIKEYEFRYKQIEFRDGQVIASVNPVWSSKQREDRHVHPMQDFELDGLQPNTHYLLQVRARNDVGWSEYSENFIFRTAPVAHPTSVANSNVRGSTGLHQFCFLLLTTGLSALALPSSSMFVGCSSSSGSIV